MEFELNETSPKQEQVSLLQEPEEQIELLEIYVEKSRALGLGQRLLWHLDKFNKRLNLPHIPEAKDLYL